MRKSTPCRLIHRLPQQLAPAICCALLLLVTYPALARDIYVNNTGGDDRFNGGAELYARQGNGPCRTIGKALRLAKAGDRIILVKNDEPYHECVTLTGRDNGAFGTFPLIIEGRGAVLDGSRPVPDEWRFVGGQLFCYKPPKFNHQLLYLDGKPAAEVKPQGNKLPALKAKQWCHFNGVIYFAAEPGRIPADYDLRHTHHQVGIGFYMCHGVVVRNLVVQGFQLDGINAHDTATNIRIQGCTLRGNARSGLSVGGASRVSLEVSLVGNNGEAQVRTEGYSRLKVLDCDLLDNTAPAVVKKGGKVTIEKTPVAPGM